VIPIEHVIGLSAALFTIAALIVVVRRHLIAILMAGQLMLAAACLAFVGFNRMWAASAAPGAELDGQIFVLMAIAAAAAQLAVGLGIGIEFVRKRGSANVDDAASMRW
jgi:NADH-quinone oxidoreductase subunit K